MRKSVSATGVDGLSRLRRKPFGAGDQFLNTRSNASPVSSVPSSRAAFMNRLDCSGSSGGGLGLRGIGLKYENREEIFRGVSVCVSADVFILRMNDVMMARELLSCLPIERAHNQTVQLKIAYPSFLGIPRGRAKREKMAVFLHSQSVRASPSLAPGTPSPAARHP